MTEINKEELYSLDLTISQFILPRLIAFKSKTAGYPACLSSEEEWNEILDKMIIAFEKHIQSVNATISTEEELQFKEGFELFHKYYPDLWI